MISFQCMGYQITSDSKPDRKGKHCQENRAGKHRACSSPILVACSQVTDWLRQAWPRTNIVSNAVCRYSNAHTCTAALSLCIYQNSFNSALPGCSLNFEAEPAIYTVFTSVGGITPSACADHQGSTVPFDILNDIMIAFLPGSPPRLY